MLLSSRSLYNENRTLSGFLFVLNWTKWLYCSNTLQSTYVSQYICRIWDKKIITPPETWWDHALHSSRRTHLELCLRVIIPHVQQVLYLTYLDDINQWFYLWQQQLMILTNVMQKIQQKVQHWLELYLEFCVIFIRSNCNLGRWEKVRKSHDFFAYRHPQMSLCSISPLWTPSSLLR